MVQHERDAVVHELKKLIDTANAPIFCVDANQKISEWNLMTAQLTKMSKEKVMGGCFAELCVTGE